MTQPMLQFSVSSNGDQWYLVRTDGDVETSVVHEPNLSSGGTVTNIKIDEFLRVNSEEPERQDFMRLVANLVSNHLDQCKAHRDALLLQLRDAAEDDVATALLGAKVQLPLTTRYEALEFVNCMVDVITGQRAIELGAEAHRIRPGFGSTHR